MASGIHLKSLGTHEHWNNAIDKQYSRNLGLNTGIELVTEYNLYWCGTCIKFTMKVLVWIRIIQIPLSPQPILPIQFL